MKHTLQEWEKWNSRVTISSIYYIPLILSDWQEDRRVLIDELADLQKYILELERGRNETQEKT